LFFINALPKNSQLLHNTKTSGYVDFKILAPLLVIAAYPSPLRNRYYVRLTSEGSDLVLLNVIRAQLLKWLHSEVMNARLPLVLY
jgi:hypothetical protein